VLADGRRDLQVIWLLNARGKWALKESRPSLKGLKGFPPTKGGAKTTRAAVFAIIFQGTKGREGTKGTEGTSLRLPEKVKRQRKRATSQLPFTLFTLDKTTLDRLNAGEVTFSNRYTIQERLDSGLQSPFLPVTKRRPFPFEESVSAHH